MLVSIIAQNGWRITALKSNKGQLSQAFGFMHLQVLIKRNHLQPQLIKVIVQVVHKKPN